MSYDNNFVAGLEWLWGEGFLSPGGPELIADILHGTDLTGKTVLDFGCGIGGIDQLLVSSYGASKVIAVDVVDSLLERARAEALRYGLSDRIEYRQIEVGALEFEDGAFDAVFSKDAIVHVADKQQMVSEFFRILRNDGVLVGSDWLGSETTRASEQVKEWLDYSKLDFHFCTSIELQNLLQAVGFERIQSRDRNAWYRAAVREEINRVSGANGLDFAKRFGREQAVMRLESSTLKMKVVDAGELRPTLFRAIKP